MFPSSSPGCKTSPHLTSPHLTVPHLTLTLSPSPSPSPPQEWIATPPSASTADLPGSTSGGYEISTTERRTGGQSLRVTDGGAWQTVPLSGAGPGATVTFGGHSRAVGTGQGLFRDYSIYADVRYEDGTELLGEAAVFRGGTTVGWARESAAFVVPRGKTVASLNLHLVYRNDPTGGGVVYFDDVFVEVTGAPPGLAGGGFEAGGDLAAEGWRGYMGGYVPSAEEAHSGGRSIAVTSGGAVQTIRPEAGTASAGSVLKMSGWAKSVGASDVAGGPAVMAVYVDVRFTDGTWLRAQEAEFRGGETEGWEYSENRIRLAKDAEEILLRAVYYGDEAARVDGAVAYFDDLAVEIV